MKWPWKKLLSIITLAYLFSYFLADPVSAAYLKFDKTSLSVSKDQTFSVDTIVDAGTDQIVSTDIYVKFDPDVLSVEKITDGTFFDTVVSNKGSDNIYIAGMLNDIGNSKTGSGTVASITFKALKDTATTLSFICDPSLTKTSKIIKKEGVTNIIECSKNESLKINSSSSESSSNPSPTPGNTSSGSLPKTGTLGNIIKIALPGLFLLIIGGISKIWIK